MNMILDNDYETETGTDDEILAAPTIRSNIALVHFPKEETNLLNQYGFLRGGDHKSHSWECPSKGAQSN